ncbi:MAG: hypothetical protein ACTSR1_00205 [Candidatus Heimdallarchaeota archaeon]
MSILQKDQLDTDIAYTNVDNDFTQQSFTSIKLNNLVGGSNPFLVQASNVDGFCGGAQISNFLTSTGGTVQIVSDGHGAANLEVEGGSISKWTYNVGDDQLYPTETSASVRSNSFFMVERSGISDNCFTRYKNTNPLIDQEWDIGLLTGGGGFFGIYNVTKNSFPIVLDKDVGDYALQLEWNAIASKNVILFDSVSYGPADYFKFSNYVININVDDQVGFNTQPSDFETSDIFRLNGDLFWLNTSGDLFRKNNSFTGFNGYYNSGFKVKSTGQSSYVFKHNDSANKVTHYLSTTTTAEDDLKEVHTHETDRVGISDPFYYVEKANGIRQTNTFEKQSIAIDEIINTGIPPFMGYLEISERVTNRMARVRCKFTALSDPTGVMIETPITLTKDTASSFNVYYYGGTLQVQNKLSLTASVTLSVYAQNFDIS